jgi:DnaJ-class molecular chaperone
MSGAEACRECDGKGYVFVMPEHSQLPRQMRCHKCDGTGIASWADPRPMRRVAPVPPSGSIRKGAQ